MEAKSREPKRVSTGPTGETVRTNIASIRKQRGMTLRGLSDVMSTIGWPMSNSTLSQIENGSRRVDVDDLVAIAIALDVSPNGLLMPSGFDSNETIEATGVQAISSKNFWYFLDGMRSVISTGLDFAVRSQPPFLRPASFTWRSTQDADQLLVSRQLETDGKDVSMKAGIGYDRIFDNEDD